MPFADVCVLGGAIVLVTGAVLRPSRSAYRQNVNRSLRQSMLWGAGVVVSMSDGVQVLLDRITGVPNLGMLVRLVLLPVASYRILMVQDDLVGADRAHRRWHLGFSLGAVVFTIGCWQLGAPHRNALPTIPVAVPLDGANGWFYALAWFFPIEILVQLGSGVRTAHRILLHAYATGYDRITCLSTLLFGMAQVCFSLVGAGLLLYPAGQASGHTSWIDLSTHTTEVCGVAGVLLSLAAYAAPLWIGGFRRPDRASPDPAAPGGRLDRLLRYLYMASSYGAVRHLALHLERVLPQQPVPLQHMETRFWRVRRADDLDLLLQLFKTMINDARLVLIPYVGPAAHGSSDPAHAAQALTDALANYQRRQKPPQSTEHENPLRNAQLFNDERFLAALWHAYKRQRHNPS